MVGSLNKLLGSPLCSITALPYSITTFFFGSSLLIPHGADSVSPMRFHPAGHRRRTRWYVWTNNGWFVGSMSQLAWQMNPPPPPPKKENADEECKKKRISKPIPLQAKTNDIKKRRWLDVDVQFRSPWVCFCRLWNFRVTARAISDSRKWGVFFFPPPSQTNFELGKKRGCGESETKWKSRWQGWRSR